MNKHGIRIIGTLIVVGILGAFIYWQFFMPDEGVGPKEGGAPSGPPQRSVLVNAVVVQPTTLRETISATGTLLPDESVSLTVETNGVVEQINFDEGSRVRQGQLLLTLDNADLRAQLDKVQYQIDLAKDKEFRQQALLERGAISQEEYDRTLTELRTFQADSALLAVQLEKTFLRAPFDGVIGLRQVSVGTYLTPNTMIANLVRVNPIKVEFAVPEKYVNRIGTGDSVKFRVESAAGEHMAIVYAKEPRIEAATRTFRMRARAFNPDNVLTVGSFASIELELDQFENTLLVPAEAIVPELGAQKIFLVKGGKAVVSEVATGLRTNEAIQVLDGLSPGDTVITGGVLQVRPGSSVEIKNLETSADV